MSRISSILRPKAQSNGHLLEAAVTPIPPRHQSRAHPSSTSFSNITNIDARHPPSPSSRSSSWGAHSSMPQTSKRADSCSAACGGTTASSQHSQLIMVFTARCPRPRRGPPAAAQLVEAHQPRRTPGQARAAGEGVGAGICLWGLDAMVRWTTRVFTRKEGMAEYRTVDHVCSHKKMGESNGFIVLHCQQYRTGVGRSAWSTFGSPLPGRPRDGSSPEVGTCWARGNAVRGCAAGNSLKIVYERRAPRGGSGPCYSGAEAGLE